MYLYQSEEKKEYSYCVFIMFVLLLTFRLISSKTEGLSLNQRLRSDYVESWIILITIFGNTIFYKF